MADVSGTVPVIPVTPAPTCGHDWWRPWWEANVKATYDNHETEMADLRYNHRTIGTLTFDQRDARFHADREVQGYYRDQANERDADLRQARETLRDERLTWRGLVLGDTLRSLKDKDNQALTIQSSLMRYMELLGTASVNLQFLRTTDAQMHAKDADVQMAQFREQQRGGVIPLQFWAPWAPPENGGTSEGALK